MRNGNPLPAELIAKLNCVTVLRMQILQVCRRKLFYGRAFHHQVMRTLFKKRQKGAINRTIRFINLLNQQVPPHIRLLLVSEQLVDQ